MSPTAGNVTWHVLAALFLLCAGAGILFGLISLGVVSVDNESSGVSDSTTPKVVPTPRASTTIAATGTTSQTTVSTTTSVTTTTATTTTTTTTTSARLFSFDDAPLTVVELVRTSGGGFEGVGSSSTVAADGNLVAVFPTLGGATSLTLLLCDSSLCNSSDTEIGTTRTVRLPEGTSITAESQTAVALDASGAAVVVLQTDNAVLLARCADANCTNGTAVAEVVDADPLAAGVQLPPKVVVSSTATSLAYVGQQPGANATLSVAQCSQGSSSCTTTRVATVSSNGVPALGMNPTNGLPTMAYFEPSASELHIKQCGDAACSDQNMIYSITVPGFGGSTPAWTVSLAVASDGSPVAAVSDDGTNTLYLVRCLSPSCNATSVQAVVSDNTDVGKFLALALDQDDFPVIAYTDSLPRRLDLMRCFDPTCADAEARSLTTVFSGSGNIWDLSVSVDNNNLAVVTFYDGSSPSRALYLARQGV